MNVRIRMCLDGARDYVLLRKATFDFELAPLPRSLQLPTAESQLNQAPSSRVPTRLPRMADDVQTGAAVLSAESQHVQ
jgi:hypothetical protein